MADQVQTRNVAAAATHPTDEAKCQLPNTPVATAATTPITAAGSANQELFQNYVSKWQAGKVSDLQGGLADVDKQIDAQLAQSSGTQVP